jgi:protein-disulfide isomerase
MQHLDINRRQWILSCLVLPVFGSVEGAKSSNVRVMIFEDLQCSDCKILRDMLDEVILPKYGGSVAFEHKDFPLPRHEWARPAAVAARHFDQVRDGLGFQFRRYCFDKQRQITLSGLPDEIREFAARAGCDPAAARAALTDKVLLDAVESDFQEGLARGIARTPTVLVGAEVLVETFPVEAMANAIDLALKAGRP